MFETALQNAIDGVWANTIGRLAWLVPDWLTGFLFLPFVSWVALIVALAFMYAWGKFGLAKAVLLGIPAVLLWLAGRWYGSPEESAPQVKRAEPPDKSPARRKTLLGRFMGRG